jgi:hypothetical protein
MPASLVAWICATGTAFSHFDARRSTFAKTSDLAPLT